MQLIIKNKSKVNQQKHITSRKMMKQFAFASLAALTMAKKTKIQVAYTEPYMTIEPCNDAILKMPIDPRSKDKVNYQCNGWQPEPGVENWDNFVSFDLKARKRGEVYKSLKIQAKTYDDMWEDFDRDAGFMEETIALWNDCEDELTFENQIFVKIQNTGCTSLCDQDMD